MKIQCAWCKATIKEVGEHSGPVSHGICHSCRVENFPETLRSVQENAQAILKESLKGRELR